MSDHKSLPVHWQDSLGRGIARTLGAVLMAVALIAHQTWPVPIWVTLGILGLSGAATLFLRYHLIRFQPDRVDRMVAERIVWITALLAVGGVQLVIRASSTDAALGVGMLAAAPIAAQALLISALLGPQLSLVGLTLSCVLLGASGAIAMPVLAPAWLAGAAGAFLINPLKRRSDLIRAVSYLSLLLAGLGASVALFTRQAPMTIAESAMWAGVAGIIATSIFWLGLAVLEKIYGIVSDWSLLELCSPDQPLIHDLCLRAPGTYAHSMMVAHLAEAAARIIGANPVICRAMATYHDIGKMKRPYAFIENQLGENIHDELSPQVSRQIIIEHVTDGIEMARQHRLPQVIQDGITQHHGTSVISYFFRKAVDRGICCEVEDEDAYRYPGPKPTSRESAILLLADQVEAASRTVRSKEDLEKLLAQIFERSLDDGQLEDSKLTFHDIKAVKESFFHTLSAARHDRIRYPGQEDESLSSGESGIDLEQIGQTPQA